MSKADENMCAAVFSSEEDDAERHQVAGQVAGHRPELPLLSHSSAMDGSGNEADGNAKAEGARPKARPKAKPKPQPRPRPRPRRRAGRI